MKIACPRCAHVVGLNSRACSRCGLAMSLGSVVKYYWKRLWKGVQAAAVVRCGRCSSPVPLRSAWCPVCLSPVTLRSAIDSVVQPSKRNWRWFLAAANASPEAKRRIQWMYLLFSLSLLWWTLALVEERFAGGLVGHAALATVFLTGLGLLTLLLVPRKLVQTIIRRASALVKLALIANFLTAILTIRMFTTTWKERALILAGLMITAWFAAFLLSRIVWPMKEEFEEFYADKDDQRRFDPTDPQGRSGRHD